MLRNLFRMSHRCERGFTCDARPRRRKDEKRAAQGNGGCRRDARDMFESGGRVRARAHGGTL